MLNLFILQYVSILFPLTTGFNGCTAGFSGVVFWATLWCRQRFGLVKGRFTVPVGPGWFSGVAFWAKLGAGNSLVWDNFRWALWMEDFWQF